MDILKHRFPIKSLIFLKPNCHAKMAPDTQALSQRSRRCSDASQCSPTLSSAAPRTRMGQGTGSRSGIMRSPNNSQSHLSGFGLRSTAATGTTSSMRARKRRDRCRERADARRREHQFYSRGPRAFALATTGRRFDLRDSNLTCRDRRQFSPRLPRRPCSWLAHPDRNMRLLRPARLCHSDDPRRVAPAGQGPRMSCDENGAEWDSLR